MTEALYLLSKAVTLIAAGALSIWLFKGRTREMIVLALVVASMAIRNTVWLGESVFELGRPEWFRLSVVWFESLCVGTAYLVLRFGSTRDSGE